jgi:hypothetical protein
LHSRWLIGIGAACLAVVILTHVAERFDIFPAMGWGLPHSPGHYVDLVSAILACVLITIGLALNGHHDSGAEWRERAELAALAGSRLPALADLRQRWHNSIGCHAQIGNQNRSQP